MPACCDFAERPAWVHRIVQLGRRLSRAWSQYSSEDWGAVSCYTARWTVFTVERQSLKGETFDSAHLVGGYCRGFCASHIDGFRDNPPGKSAVHFIVRRYKSRALDAYRYLSLRCRSHSSSASASHCNKLQLLYLPTIRCPLGILPGKCGSNWSAEGWSVDLLMASQGSRIRSLQQMRLHYPL